MKYFLMGMALMLIIGIATAEPTTWTSDITISVPTTKADGSALPLSELKELTLRWGKKSGEYTDFVILRPDTKWPYKWSLKVDVPLGSSTLIYYVATATNTAGKESKPSAETTKRYYANSESEPAAPGIVSVNRWQCTPDKPGYSCTPTK